MRKYIKYHSHRMPGSQTEPNSNLFANAEVLRSGSYVPRAPSDTNPFLLVVVFFYLLLFCLNCQFHSTFFPLSCFLSFSLFAQLFLLSLDILPQLSHDYMVLLHFQIVFSATWSLLLPPVFPSSHLQNFQNSKSMPQWYQITWSIGRCLKMMNESSASWR